MLDPLSSRDNCKKGRFVLGLIWTNKKTIDQVLFPGNYKFFDPQKVTWTRSLLQQMVSASGFVNFSLLLHIHNDEKLELNVISSSKNVLGT